MRNENEERAQTAAAEDYTARCLDNGRKWAGDDRPRSPWTLRTLRQGSTLKPNGKIGDKVGREKGRAIKI